MLWSARAGVVSKAANKSPDTRFCFLLIPLYKRGNLDLDLVACACLYVDQIYIMLWGPNVPTM